MRSAVLHNGWHGSSFGTKASPHVVAVVVTVVVGVVVVPVVVLVLVLDEVDVE